MRITSILSLVLLIYLAPALAQTSTAKCELNTTDYAVLTAVLNGLGRPEDPEEAWANKRFVIEDSTATYKEESEETSRWGFRSNSKEAPAKKTIHALTSKAAISCPLATRFGDPNSYQMVSRDEIESLFKKGQDGWDKCYKKYPNAGGFWEFSRPGLNDNGDEALMYVGHHCGWLCGTGHLFLVRKQGETWKVVNRLMLWIS